MRVTRGRILPGFEQGNRHRSAFRGVAGLIEPLRKVAFDLGHLGLDAALDRGDVLGQFGIEGRGRGFFASLDASADGQLPENAKVGGQLFNSMSLHSLSTVQPRSRAISRSAFQVASSRDTVSKS
jgi:hypothetical protein